MAMKVVRPFQFIFYSSYKSDHLNPIDCACDIPTDRPALRGRSADEGWEIRNIRADATKPWIPLYYPRADSFGLTEPYDLKFNHTIRLI